MNTKDIIQQYYQSFNQKNDEQMLGLLNDNILHEINESEAQVGKVAFQQFLNSMHEHYEEKLSDFSILISDNGERASAEFICEGIYLKTAQGLPAARKQTYRIRVGAFFEFKHNKIARITNHYNLQHWIKLVS
jgi:steroid delta-isomerase-like uncharacterized protein